MADEVEESNLLPTGENIIPINIEEEMKTAYIDYSMSVIVSRAIPDVRDGLKPVHRRVLYGMNELGLAANKPYKKSARIVGEVLGKYHPHGDGSVYDAMVRMAQDWSLRYPLIEGQGNFGSVDGDSPAAMRYTEARFSKIAEETLADIEKDTVDMTLNFDDTLEEPTVLPSRIPTLLINGASGIAVGMATNILPHNLGEVVDGTIAYIDNRDITIAELMEFVKAPDFPTAASIYGYEGVRQAFETGRGKIVVRAVAEIEEYHGRERILVTEIPYQVNKALLIARAAELVNEKKLEGISDIRDESDRTGMRIIFELKREANANVVLNSLYKFTQLQTSFGVNNIALVGGRPKLLNLKEMIGHFVDFRHEVVTRRTRYELSEAEKRAHILEGLLKALDYLDEVIALIRAAATPEAARDGLMTTFELSEIQARAILELTLRRLTGLERDKIKEEYAELMKRIEWLKAVLDSEQMRMDIIKEEMLEIKKKYADERRTKIVYAGDEIDMEDLIADDKVVITISHLGYIKRTLASEYKAQSRGGRGSRGGATRDEDFIEYVFTATNHNYILFFTEAGQVYWLKVYEIPEGSKTSKGRAIQNLINIPKEDKLKAFINVVDLRSDEALDNQFVVLCTKKGIIKKTTLRAFSRPRATGIAAITVREGDTLLDAKLTDGTMEIMMAVRSGKAIRFLESDVRPMGRNASGVMGVRLANEEDEVVGMICVNATGESAPEDETDIPDPETVAETTEELDEVMETAEEILEGKLKHDTILVVTDKGYGKRSEVSAYRLTRRGAKGVKTINITGKTGKLIAILNVNDEDDLMIMNKSGITIRMAASDLRVMGRATQGVRLIKLGESDSIAAITKIQQMPSAELNELPDENSPENLLPDADLAEGIEPEEV
ncbi:MAG: DNA gyrase subunit A [Chitinophagales bacterium]|nr:DNA gyrase subunit A [Chitinophagales bacterium]